MGLCSQVCLGDTLTAIREAVTSNADQIRCGRLTIVQSGQTYNELYPMVAGGMSYSTTETISFDGQEYYRIDTLQLTDYGNADVVEEISLD